MDEPGEFVKLGAREKWREKEEVEMIIVVFEERNFEARLFFRQLVPYCQKNYLCSR